MTVSIETIRHAHERITPSIVRTPFELSETLSSIVGSRLYLKHENQQFTASFKERGALNRLLDLSAAERARGAVAMSAGNHAQALAYHGKRLGIPITIVMPRTTPNAKVEQTRAHGAEVILHGSQFDETRAFTRDLARERALTLVHPYDDPAVIAGQGTLSLEMLEIGYGIDTLLIPIGGGGLISGVAIAAKAILPSIQVIGVQSERYPSAHHLFHGLDPRDIPDHDTVADGIAVKSPGELTMEIIRAQVDDVVLVREEDIEQAIFMLAEIEKTVVEGAGAAGVAAALRYKDRFQGQQVGTILCGGNIDMMTLSSVLQRGMVRSHRLVRLRVEVPDIPGALGQVTQLIGELDSNIVEISHQRAFGASSARAAVVEMVLQLRGEEQAEQVLDALGRRGLEAQLVR
ncbi:MAG: threonine dehydratase [Myxococcales bacterium SG8_38]|nr:MAG: threonine dehydratase [Myxococcales bacterium SG8_38]